MKFNGTRRVYTGDRVRKMRESRKLKTPTVSGVSTHNYLNCLGDLLAAGHLKINHRCDINVKDVVLSNQTSNIKQMHKEIKIIKQMSPDYPGESPDIVGYLQSGHPKDPTFRLKGWINTDGTIRIELVK